MTGIKSPHRRGWFLLGALGTLVLFSLALTASGAFAGRLTDASARPTAPGAPFAAPTPGNLIIYRVGSGTGSLTNAGNPVFLDRVDYLNEIASPNGSFMDALTLFPAPVPEPSSLALLGIVACGGLPWMIRRVQRGRLRAVAA